jgi:hypothetical protein
LDADGDGTFERWIDRPGRDVRACVLRRPYAFESPFGHEPFALLVVICDETVTPAEQWGLSQQIVRSGCRYVCAAGHECGTWDDSVDWADLEQHGFRLLEPEELIMTAWHARESPHEIVDFLLDDTCLAGRPFGRYLVAFVGDDARLRGEYAALVRARGAEAS